MPADRACDARVAGLLVMLALSAICCSCTPHLLAQTARSPVALLGLPENRLIRWPSIAVLSDTVFVATNVFPIRGDSLGARPAYLGRLRQNPAGDLVAFAPLDLPPGDFQFAYPRIVAAGGKLHLVWAEFPSPARTTFAWTQFYPTSLWHAVLNYGSWSAPERIVTDRWFVWNDVTGGVAVDATGALHVAIWPGDSTGAVHHLRLAGGHWDTSRLPHSGLNPATAITTHGATVVIAFVDVASDTQRVMVVESTDQGKHWTNPIVASRRTLTSGSVDGLALAATADGQLLVIGEKALDSFHLDTIRVLRVKGATVSPIARLIAPPPTSAGFELAMTPCGSAVMLIRTFSLTPQIFELTIPRDSSATMIRPLLGTAAIAVSPGIAASRRSVIAVFAYNTTSGTPARSVAMTLPGCLP